MVILQAALKPSLVLEDGMKILSKRLQECLPVAAFPVWEACVQIQQMFCAVVSPDLIQVKQTPERKILLVISGAESKVSINDNLI